jgi:hypothetical protein
MRSNDELANLCLQRAWDEDVDDRSRFLLEHAAKRINQLGRRGMRLARKLELAEMREQTWQQLYTDSQITMTLNECSLKARVFAGLRRLCGAAARGFAGSLGGSNSQTNS